MLSNWKSLLTNNDGDNACIFMAGQLVADEHAESETRGADGLESKYIRQAKMRETPL